MIAAPDSAGLIEHEALAAARRPAAGERVDVGPPGHTVRVSWAGADGVTIQQFARRAHAEIERLQQEIAKRLGYKLVDHRLELYGVPIDDKAKAGKR